MRFASVFARWYSAEVELCVYIYAYIQRYIYRERVCVYMCMCVRLHAFSWTVYIVLCVHDHLFLCACMHRVWAHSAASISIVHLLLSVCPAASADQQGVGGRSPDLPTTLHAGCQCHHRLSQPLVFWTPPPTHAHRGNQSFSTVLQTYMTIIMEVWSFSTVLQTYMTIIMEVWSFSTVLQTYMTIILEVWILQGNMPGGKPTTQRSIQMRTLLKVGSFLDIAYIQWKPAVAALYYIQFLEVRMFLS